MPARGCASCLWPRSTPSSPQGDEHGLTCLGKHPRDGPIWVCLADDDFDLVFVGGDDGDLPQQIGIDLSGRGGVEDDRRARLVGDLDGATHGIAAALRAAPATRRPQLMAFLRARRGWGQRAFAPEATAMVFSPSASTKIRATPEAASGVADDEEVSIPSCGVSGDSLITKDVAAQAGNKGHAAPRGEPQRQPGWLLCRRRRR